MTVLFLLSHWNQIKKTSNNIKHNKKRDTLRVRIAKKNENTTNNIIFIKFRIYTYKIHWKNGKERKKYINSQIFFVRCVAIVVVRPTKEKKKKFNRKILSLVFVSWYTKHLSKTKKIVYFSVSLTKKKREELIVVVQLLCIDKVFNLN